MTERLPPHISKEERNRILHDALDKYLAEIDERADWLYHDQMEKLIRALHPEFKRECAVLRQLGYLHPRDKIAPVGPVRTRGITGTD